MLKITTLVLLVTAFIGSNDAFATTPNVTGVMQSIERLEKHLDMISKRFNGKLGAEEKATKEKIADLKKKLEEEKTQTLAKGGVVDPEIAKLEARLAKIQAKFGMGVLNGEEEALNKKIQARKVGS